MAVKTIVKFRPRGKCRRFAAIWFTFPEKNSENGGRINIFEGKVHQMTGKQVHFPPELTHAASHYPTLQMYTSNYPDFDPDFANGHLQMNTLIKKA